MPEFQAPKIKRTDAATCVNCWGENLPCKACDFLSWSTQTKEKTHAELASRPFADDDAQEQNAVWYCHSCWDVLNLDSAYKQTTEGLRLTFKEKSKVTGATRSGKKNPTTSVGGGGGAKGSTTGTTTSSSYSVKKILEEEDYTEGDEWVDDYAAYRGTCAYCGDRDVQVEEDGDGELYCMDCWDEVAAWVREETGGSDSEKLVDEGDDVKQESRHPLPSSGPSSYVPDQLKKKGASSSSCSSSSRTLVVDVTPSTWRETRDEATGAGHSMDVKQPKQYKKHPKTAKKGAQKHPKTATAAASYSTASSVAPPKALTYAPIANSMSNDGKVIATSVVFHSWRNESAEFKKASIDAARARLGLKSAEELRVAEEKDRQRRRARPIIEGTRKPEGRTVDDDFLFHPQLSQVIVSCLTFQEQIDLFRGLNTNSVYCFDRYAAEEGAEYVAKEFGYEGSTFRPFKRRGFRNDAVAQTVVRSAGAASSYTIVSAARFGSRDESRLRLRVVPFLDSWTLAEFSSRVLSLVKTAAKQIMMKKTDAVESEVGVDTADDDCQSSRDDHDEDDEHEDPGTQQEDQMVPVAGRVKTFEEVLKQLQRTSKSENSVLPSLKLFVAKQFDFNSLIHRQNSTVSGDNSSSSSSCNGHEFMLLMNPDWMRTQFKHPWACNASRLEVRLSTKIPNTNDFGSCTRPPTKMDLDRSRILNESVINSVLEHLVVSSPRTGKTGLCLSKHFFSRVDTLKTVDLRGLKQLDVVDESFLADCTSLETVQFPKDVRVTKIGNRFLARCTSLKFVDLSTFTKLLLVGSNFCSRSGVERVRLCDTEDFAKAFVGFSDPSVAPEIENEWYQQLFIEE